MAHGDNHQPGPGSSDGVTNDMNTASCHCALIIWASTIVFWAMVTLDINIPY